jgi:hypothetical protein
MLVFVRWLRAYLIVFLVGPCATAAANPNNALTLHSTNDAVVLGPRSKAVLQAIRAAESGDVRSFKAQLSIHMWGPPPKMKEIDLRPCLLQSVVQQSSILVTAKWICRAGKVDAVATRGFLLSRGRIAAITSEPIPEYHLDVQ